MLHLFHEENYCQNSLVKTKAHISQVLNESVALTSQAKSFNHNSRQDKMLYTQKKQKQKNIAYNTMNTPSPR